MACKLSRVFAALVLLVGSAMAQAVETAWHRLDIGFNIGYPDRVHYFEPALAEVERLGVRDVRIFEVFDGRRGNEYQARLKDALDRALKFGMRPLISISNVHARLEPQDEVRSQLEAQLPLGVRRQLEQSLTYTNRFPPNDWDGYRASIQELVDFLFATYGKDRVQEWSFEIGNEPDAPVYFWGSDDQFARLYLAAVKVLHLNGIRSVGGFGLTHHPIFLDDQREQSSAYQALMANVSRIKDENGFLSFHLYERRDEPRTPLAGIPEWLNNSKRPVMITEWNVSSRGEVAAKTFAHTGAWGAEFIRLLADCARYGIDRLYVFDLMDYPPQHSPQLGAFDRDGKAQPWYREFAAVYGVMRGGYRVVEGGEGLTIEGAGGQRIILSLDHELTIASPIVYSPFAQSGTTRKINPGEWVIVSGKTAQGQK